MRAGAPRRIPQPGQFVVRQGRVEFPKALLYPHGRGGVEEGRALIRYSRGSGGVQRPWWRKLLGQ